MKHVVAVALSLLLIAASADAGSRRRAVRKPLPLDTTYLDAARQAAAWLTSLERRNGDAISWPVSNVATSAQPGLSNGAAGIGAFFLRLHQVTGEARYLETARGAARTVATQLRNPAYGFDWQSGAVGGGEFLLLMYRQTREQRHLDDARAIADSLLSMATRDAQGSHWTFPGSTNVYTGISHGTAGAAMFFLHLHEESHRAEDLQVALDGYRWMRQHTVPLANGFGWKRLIADTTAYHGFCGGSSGILHLLDELHRVTGDDAYLRDLIATADGLASSARTQPAGQASWPYTSAGTGSPAVIYCHGTSCASAALARAWTIAGDARHQSLARDGAERLAAIATTYDGASPVWPHIERTTLLETGYQTGIASVGYTYLKLHAAFGDEQYLAHATDAADALVRLAEHPAPGQSRWINILSLPTGSSEVVAYETGWYKGAAGIGLFFLDLHERINGLPAISRFSPVHP